MEHAVTDIIVKAEPAAVVIHRERSVVVTRPGGPAVVVSQPTPPQVVITRGVPGPAGDASGALLVENRLSEFDTEQKKADARANIGLAVIDGGTFF